MDRDRFLACPRCHGSLQHQPDSYQCPACSRGFPVVDGTPSFLTDEAASKDMNAFWDAGWKKRSTEDQHAYLQDGAIDQRRCREHKAEYERLDHPMLRAIPKPGETVLNIGCGLGEGPMFTLLGARDYIGVDFSFTAAHATGGLIRKLGSRGFTVQANAEMLPIASDSIDIVYSCGVLHHTPSTEKTLEEVLRVMKPGGKAVISLYSTWSPTFLLLRLLGTVKSLIDGKGKGWYEFSECAWDTEGQQNPWTKTYSTGELQEIFRSLKVDHLRIFKHGFAWGNNIPKLGKHIDRTRVGQASCMPLQKLFGSLLVSVFRKPV